MSETENSNGTQASIECPDGNLVKARNFAGNFARRNVGSDATITLATKLAET